jgi:hypothetical protein
VRRSFRFILRVAIVGSWLASSAISAADVSSDSVRDARAWQASASAGVLFPTVVRAHLRTDTDPSPSLHADATLPGPLLEYGVYARAVRLGSRETGGTASLFTFGVQAKYELRVGRRNFLRTGLLVGMHDLTTDTIDNAIGLDLGVTLEWAVQIASHVRLRLAAQGTSMVVGGIPAERVGVWFEPTVAVALGAEYVFRH